MNGWFAAALFAAVTPASAGLLDDQLDRLLRLHAPDSLRAFRVAEARDLVGNWEDHRGAYRAQADFDGDGSDDQAALLVRRKGPGFRLIVVLSVRSEKPVVLVLEDQSWAAQGFGLDVAPPGSYKTARGKGYSVGASDPAQIELSLPAINRYHFESQNGFWFWDRGAKKFRFVQMSD